MKKILSFSAFVFLLANLSFAQTAIPNGSFENWGSNGNPTSWGTSDGVITGLPLGIPDPHTADRDTTPVNVYSGTSSVHLVTRTITAPIIGDIDVPGVVSLGSLGLDIQNQRPIVFGLPYTSRPDSIRFASKFTSGPGGTDTGNVAVTLTRWTPNGRQVIGNIIVPIVDHSTFTLFTEKIVYHSNFAPDTLLLQGVSTSSRVSIVESEMWLDAVSFIGLDTAFKAYINPGRDLQSCEGDTTRFRTDNVSTDTVQWFKNNVAISGETLPQYNALTAGTYSLQVKHQGTVYTSDSVVLTVNSLPAVSFTLSASQDTVCLNSASFVLNGVAPSGGLYYGDLVDTVSGSFSPVVPGLSPVTYSVTNNFGCTATVTQNVLVKVCTGIEVLEEGLKVNIYPNPASNFMIVEADQKLIGGNIEIYDVVGKLVLKETIASAKSNLNLSSFAEGVYTIRLTNAAKKAVANSKVSVAH